MTDMMMFRMQYDNMCCRMQNSRVYDMAGTFGLSSVRPKNRQC